MNKFSVLLATLALLAEPAKAEIRSMEMTIFGMD